MDNWIHLIGLSSGREEKTSAVDFEELTQHEPEVALTGALGVETLRAMFAQINEAEAQIQASAATSHRNARMASNVIDATARFQRRGEEYWRDSSQEDDHAIPA